MQRPLKVAYIYEMQTRATNAGRMVAKGFRNAFTARTDVFREFDAKQIGCFWKRGPERDLVEYAPDLLFASSSHARLLPIKQLPQSSFIFWGEFYKPANLERQTACISKADKSALKNIGQVSRTLVWSQHSDEINEEYFSGYERDLGLTLLPLLHCADEKQLREPAEESSIVYDYVWIGNVRHRKEPYLEFIAPLRKLGPRCIELLDNDISPSDEQKQELYSKAFLAPNVHTTVQRRHRVVLNERTFTSSLMGGFQVCDNPLARRYFKDDELVIAENPAEYFDLCRYYLRNPAERLTFIRRAQARILADHTYNVRIQQILDSLRRH
jgi:hypothetical protein